jgi:hypothetical protein
MTMPEAKKAGMVFPSRRPETRERWRACPGADTPRVPSGASTKTLRHQQTLAERKISVVVLGQSPGWLVKQRPEAIVAAADSATVGSYARVDIPFK